jgi:hypothetical protein
MQTSWSLGSTLNVIKAILTIDAAALLLLYDFFAWRSNNLTLKDRPTGLISAAKRVFQQRYSYLVLVPILLQWVPEIAEFWAQQVVRVDYATKILDPQPRVKVNDSYDLPLYNINMTSYFVQPLLKSNSNSNTLDNTASSFSFRSVPVPPAWQNWTTTMEWLDSLKTLRPTYGSITYNDTDNSAMVLAGPVTFQWSPYHTTTCDTLLLYTANVGPRTVKIKSPSFQGISCSTGRPGTGVVYPPPEVPYYSDLYAKAFLGDVEATRFVTGSPVSPFSRNSTIINTFAVFAGNYQDTNTNPLDSIARDRTPAQYFTVTTRRRQLYYDLSGATATERFTNNVNRIEAVLQSDYKDLCDGLLGPGTLNRTYYNLEYVEAMTLVQTDRSDCMVSVLIYAQIAEITVAEITWQMFAYLEPDSGGWARHNAPTYHGVQPVSRYSTTGGWVYNTQKVGSMVCDYDNSTSFAVECTRKAKILGQAMGGFLDSTLTTSSAPQVSTSYAVTVIPDYIVIFILVISFISLVSVGVWMWTPQWWKADVFPILRATMMASITDEVLKNSVTGTLRKAGSTTAGLIAPSTRPWEMTPGMWQAKVGLKRKEVFIEVGDSARDKHSSQYKEAGLVDTKLRLSGTSSSVTPDTLQKINGDGEKIVNEIIEEEEESELFDPRRHREEFGYGKQLSVVTL